MDKLHMMRVFVRVAEEGSFIGAAQRLQISNAYASRSVAQLEAELHTRLLNRSTRRVALTESGQRYLDRCRRILTEVDEAEAEARDAQAKPYGRLRVHATTSFGQRYVLPAIMRYRQMNPSVSVQLTLSQHVPDLLDEGYDVSLQLSMADLPDSELISHRLGDVHSVLCAAPSYLTKHGTPQTVQELSGHACLQISTSAFARDSWHLDGPNGRETFALPPADLQVNLVEALTVALCEGTGIGAVPMAAAADALRTGALVRVLPEYQLQKINVYLLYPSRKFLDAKISTFVDFAKKSISQALTADKAALSNSTD